MTRPPRPTADDWAASMFTAIMLTVLIFGCNQWSFLAMSFMAGVGVTALFSKRQPTAEMFKAEHPHWMLLDRSDLIETHAKWRSRRG